MSISNHLDWPFFEPRHRTLAADLEQWAKAHLHAGEAKHPSQAEVDEECRMLVRRLGEGGWLSYAVGGTAYGGSGEAIDTRAVCLLRETLARYSGLADFAFAMQGLGSGAISLLGTHGQKELYLPNVASGKAVAAFALSETEAGSDVAATRCSAV